MKRNRVNVLMAAVGLTLAGVFTAGLLALGKPPVPPITRAEFVSSVVGRTQDEVISAHGRPARVSDGFPGDESFSYRDPEGGAGNVVVVFTNRKAVAVRPE